MLQHPFMAIFAIPLPVGLTNDQDIEIDAVRLRRVPSKKGTWRS
jgi:hypothetical protein